MTRRSTLDLVLRRAVAAEPGVTVRGGAQVRGLLATPGRPPHVSGVSTSGGDLRADLVVDASGRRSALDSWLAAIGARATGTWRAECGVAYYSRHYRRSSGGSAGPPTTRVVAALDEFTAGIFSGDNDTMVLVVAPLVEDKRFRAVANPDVFTAVLRTVRLYAGWLDVLDPISPIFPMGGLHNTLRRLVVHGSPVATGLHAIGDSVCTTNPSVGRGLSLALQGATDLVDALSRHGEDRTGLPLALDEQVDRHVAPFYRDQAAIDAGRLAALRHTIFGAPPPPAPSARSDRVDFAELRNAAPFDPVVFRAFWKVMGMVGLPEDVYTDPAVVAATREVIRTHGTGPAIAQPSRDRLLAALTD